MSEEKQLILKKIDELLNKRKADLLKCLPSVHDIDDGIIIRFFTEWDNCDTNQLIRFKKIVDDNKPEDITFFYFLPKHAVIELKKRDYIHCIACLSGKVEIEVDGVKTILTGFKKFCFDSEEFQGVALEDTYVITSNKR